MGAARGLKRFASVRFSASLVSKFDLTATSQESGYSGVDARPRSLPGSYTHSSRKFVPMGSSLGVLGSGATGVRSRCVCARVYVLVRALPVDVSFNLYFEVPAQDSSGCRCLWLFYNQDAYNQHVYVADVGVQSTRNSNNKMSWHASIPEARAQARDSVQAPHKRDLL